MGIGQNQKVFLKSGRLRTIGTSGKDLVQVGQLLVSLSVDDILNNFGVQTVKQLADNLNQKKINASGKLQESINFKYPLNGDTYNFELSLLDYYEFVDKGRKPGKQPPRGKIFEWIRQKDLSGATGKVGLIKDDFKRRKTLAFLIARKIGKFGTKPTNFFSSVVNRSAINKLKNDIAEALGRDVVFTITKL